MGSLINLMSTQNMESQETNNHTAQFKPKNAHGTVLIHVNGRRGVDIYKAREYQITKNKYGNYNVYFSFVNDVHVNAPLFHRKIVGVQFQIDDRGTLFLDLCSSSPHPKKSMVWWG